MNHKKITVAGIMVTLLFSFGTLRPMKAENEKVDPSNKKKKATVEQKSMETVEKKDKKTPAAEEVIKIGDKTPETEKTITPNFDDLTGLEIFEDEKHLKELCLLQKNLMDYHGLSVIQKTGKLAKGSADFGIPTLASGIVGYSLRDVMEGNLNLKKFVAPTIAATVYATHWITKDYFGSTIKKWDKKAQTGLRRKQVALETSLEKIVYSFTNCFPDDHGMAFKSIALLSVLNKQANKSKKFEPCGKFDPRKKYVEKMEPSQKWLQSLTETKDPLKPFMSGASKKIKSLMDAPPEPEKINTDKKKMEKLD